jgi:hypothetical protein
MVQRWIDEFAVAQGTGRERSSLMAYFARRYGGVFQVFGVAQKNMNRLEKAKNEPD